MLLKARSLRPILAGLSLFAAGCAVSADNQITHTLDSNFQLRVDHSAQILTTDIEVGFDAVNSDSRCGKDEVCVWEGDAIIELWLRSAGGTKEAFEVHTNSKSPNSVIYKGFSIRLVSLFPQPLSGHKIAAEQYVATIQVTRGLSGHENIL